jgi:3-deoxy-manno-octulosonate cytidylyltransferase (CMP-KDO synthetase)
MSVDFHVIIPARLNSTRLPRKLLLDLGGITVIERTYRQAVLAKPLSITIATDSDEIADHVKKFGADVVMTSKHHTTGTDRIAEAALKLGYKNDAIIVNVQGDEPFISPVLIKQVANSLDMTEPAMATLCWPIDNQSDFENSNIVKVVRDCKNNALYFSRMAIPFESDPTHMPRNIFKHIGIYAYRMKFLLEVVKLPICHLERSEKLEQLRVLWYGFKIKVDKASVASEQEINTKQDLDTARAMLETIKL